MQMQDSQGRLKNKSKAHQDTRRDTQDWGEQTLIYTEDKETSGDLLGTRHR